MSSVYGGRDMEETSMLCIIIVVSCFAVRGMSHSVRLVVILEAVTWGVLSKDFRDKEDDRNHIGWA